jgi:protein-S-isoprenylcysteine O-methyltransferase Ste14
MPVLIKIAIYFSIIFFLSEMILLLTKRSSRESSARQKDKGSLIILWIIITISFMLGFRMANYGIWKTADYLFALTGLLVLVTGLIIRWTSIIQLKKAFTVDVAISKAHELKTDDLYRIIRHPSYLGLLLIMAGESVAMDSLRSFLVVVLPMIIAILYRIHVEEKLLEEGFGEMYQVYMRKTKRIIPYIY